MPPVLRPRPEPEPHGVKRKAEPEPLDVKPQLQDTTVLERAVKLNKLPRVTEAVIEAFHKKTVQSTPPADLHPPGVTAHVDSTGDVKPTIATKAALPDPQRAAFIRDRLLELKLQDDALNNQLRRLWEDQREDHNQWIQRLKEQCRHIDTILDARTVIQAERDELLAEQHRACMLF